MRGRTRSADKVALTHSFGFDTLQRQRTGALNGVNGAPGGIRSCAMARIDAPAQKFTYELAPVGGASAVA
jgi:hypothetical protein